MNFSQALEALKSGKTVERLEWRDRERTFTWATCYVLKLAHSLSGNCPFLAIYDSEVACRTWIPTGSDLLAEDWQVVDIQKQKDN